MFKPNVCVLTSFPILYCMTRLRGCIFLGACIETEDSEVIVTQSNDETCWLRPRGNVI